MPSNAEQGPFRAVRLRAEGLENPLGLGTGSPRLSWALDGLSPAQFQTAYEIAVSSTRANAGKAHGDLWSSGRVAGDTSSVRYGGDPAASRRRAWWRVRVWDRAGRPAAWSRIGCFEVGLLHQRDWLAQWISPGGPRPPYDHPAPIFRREFDLSIGSRSARLYVSALGLYEVEINGQPVTHDLFRPGFTDYEKIVQYQAYDVRRHLRPGTNALGIRVGNGWYRNFRFAGMRVPDRRERERRTVALLAQLEIEEPDGSRRTIATGPGWCSGAGGVLSTSIFNGERYDARREPEGWSEAGFRAPGWRAVRTFTGKVGRCVATLTPPVRAFGHIKPVARRSTAHGTLVLDFGQAMSGWCVVRGRAVRGQRLRVRYSDLVDAAGELDTRHLRSARQTDEFVFGHSGRIVDFEPRFTYHGFRYAEFSGLDRRALRRLDIRARPVHTDLDLTGTVRTSNRRINRLATNIRWTQRSNFFDVVTDCNQRDERLPWISDPCMFCSTSAYFMDVATFYAKMVREMCLAQHRNGALCYTAPDKLNGAGGAYGTGDAIIIIPWLLYRHYADREVLQLAYPHMRSWLAFRERRIAEGYRERGTPDLLTEFGDWLAFRTGRDRYDDPGPVTDKTLLSLAWQHSGLVKVAHIAGILGDTEAARRDRQAARRLRSRFAREFITRSGHLVSDTQTAYALALASGIIGGATARKVAGRLAERVDRDGHITTGFMGTRHLCPMLCEFGHARLAYRLLLRRDYPSWLYQVDQGATTIWERWDSIKIDGEPQDPHMNSFNHMPFGAIGEWMFEYAAGLRPDIADPGFRNILFKPHPDDSMRWFQVRHESHRGLVECGWRIARGRLRVDLRIPNGSTGSLQLPSRTRAGAVQWAPPVRLGPGRHTFFAAFAASGGSS